jgi:hypothetical protein
MGGSAEATATRFNRIWQSDCVAAFSGSAA